MVQPVPSMKVVTFGEVRLRLATPGRLRLNQTLSLEMIFGGAAKARETR